MKRSMLIWSLGTLLMSVEPSYATPVEWSPSDGGNGHLYEAVYMAAGTSWHAIDPDPEGAGWHLVTIASDPENQFVFDLVKDDAQFWIRAGGNASGPWLGGFQPPGSPEPGGTWQWGTSEPWSYTNWASAEPNNLHPGEDCLHFFARGQASASTWNDLPGTYPLPGFIREIPEPSAGLLVLVGAGVLCTCRSKELGSRRPTKRIRPGVTIGKSNPSPRAGLGKRRIGVAHSGQGRIGLLRRAFV